MFWWVLFFAWTTVLLGALWLVAVAKCRRLTWERDEALKRQYPNVKDWADGMKEASGG